MVYFIFKADQFSYIVTYLVSCLDRENIDNCLALDTPDKINLFYQLILSQSLDQGGSLLTGQEDQIEQEESVHPSLRKIIQERSQYKRCCPVSGSWKVLTYTAHIFRFKATATRLRDQRGVI